MQHLFDTIQNSGCQFNFAQPLRPKKDELNRRREKRIQDDIEHENQLIQNWRNQEQADENEVVDKKVEEADDENGRPNHVAMFFTGLFLLLCGLIFIVADVSLSIAAIYALGFKDVRGTKWGDTIFNPSYWVTHWEGVSVCLGIAAITIFFKYAYERIIHSTAPFRRGEKIFMAAVMLICLTTVGFLGRLRADYLITNMMADANRSTQREVASDITNNNPPAGGFQTQQRTENRQEDFFGVSTTVAFWSMFLVTILFPFLGAVSLSEGLNRTFDGLGWMVRKTVEPFGKLSEKVSFAKDRSAPTILDKEMERLEMEIKQLEGKQQQINQEISNAQKDATIIEKKIAVWQKAIESYAVRWDAIARLEFLLYLHGYEQGRMLLGSEGAYKVISGILANELTIRPDTFKLESPDDKSGDEAMNGTDVKMELK